MKKITCQIPANLFELIPVYLEGYGIEVIKREGDTVSFALYTEDSHLPQLKQKLNETFQNLSAGQITSLEDIKEENWAEKWKENFKPIKAGLFIIIPEWEKTPQETGLIPIKLKIGMAFGTGLHPSTQLILKLLPQFVQKGDTVLDLGTGSGILAIASKKLGADKVVGIDIHKEAVKECKKNSQLNQTQIQCFEKDISQIDGQFDVVLANLQKEIFDKYLKKIATLFKKYLIISGIYRKTERDSIIQMGKGIGLTPVKELSQREGEQQEAWYGIVFTKQANRLHKP
ncbi:MAG: 50S ribosomal protein L11 methyltransferase [Aquificae bacterium]|nr:50S ribosomal protein L11 methyltransferase [Aquificota bacterium]